MNVHEIVTNQILEALKSGVIPWERPWKRTIEEGGVSLSVAPINLVSGRAYRGINVFLLGFAPFASPYWVSLKQANELGGRVSLGQKGSLAVFWKWGQKKNADGSLATGADGQPSRTVPYLRYYKVFNVEQCEGLKHKRLTAWAKSEEARKVAEAERIAAIAAGTWQVNDPSAPHVEAEAAVAAYVDGPKVILDERTERAFYRPSTDEVAMPSRGLFKSQSAWYATLFHELSHSTGAESRLDRLAFMRGHGAAFGSPEYAREELVAELGSAFLMGEVGLPVEIADRAAYLSNWMQALKQDVRLITVAAGQAQKAAERILGRVLGGGRQGDSAHVEAEPESHEQVAAGEGAEMGQEGAQQAA